jgi:hypothetical protein
MWQLPIDAHAQQQDKRRPRKRPILFQAESAVPFLLDCSAADN